MALAYFNLYYLMPRLIPKHIGLFAFLVLFSTMVIVLIRIVVTYELVTTEIFKESSLDENLFGINYIVAAYIGELYVVGIASSVKLTKDWITQKNHANELEKINLETELAFLRSQVQPHFFFNTLNNLYSLTLDKSDKAPDTVLKLSELMSYVVYEAKKKKALLSREINHIHNYLDLERLRYGDRLDVSFEMTGEIDSLQIAPVLLLPFVENSFKHGVGNHLERIPIKINIDVIPKQLIFRIENDKLDKNDNNGLISPEYHGVGLKNTRRRLEILYQNQYDLTIDEDNDKFITTLKIPI
jgi:LytS/YehU family sensor histidine kinase